MALHPLLEPLRGGLIASCQPVRGGPLDAPHFVAALAQAALIGGARAVRLEGLPDLRAVRPLCGVPIIGLVKRQSPGSPVYITPTLQDVRDLAQAGADLIAFDATDQPRPVSVSEMVQAIHAEGKLAMADVSTLEEGLAAWEAGAEVVGSTLSGYTPHSPQQEGPDLALVRSLSRAGVRTVAEGRIWTPEEARTALDCGAYAVTVGSALNRLEQITQRFVRALEGAAVIHAR